MVKIWVACAALLLGSVAGSLSLGVHAEHAPRAGKAVGGNATIPFTPKPELAEAVVQPREDALQTPLRARLGFEALDLELTGVARFREERACFICQGAGSRPMIYKEGDVLGGFRIAAIDRQSVEFEREGERFWLAVGERTGSGLLHSEPADDFEAAPAEDLIDATEIEVDEHAPTEALDKSVPLKAAAANAKRRTRLYQTASLIEDGKRAGPLRTAAAPSEDGKSDFISPLSGKISSEFGYRRHPFGGGRKFHHGVDIAAPYGSKVRAAADGVVVKVRYTPTLGRYISLRHADGFVTRYGHLSRQDVKVGDRVSQGQVIGREGNTGRSTGPHLHFEVWKNGIAVDPLSYINPGK